MEKYQICRLSGDRQKRRQDGGRKDFGHLHGLQGIVQNSCGGQEDMRFKMWNEEKGRQLFLFFDVDGVPRDKAQSVLQVLKESFGLKGKAYLAVHTGGGIHLYQAIKPVSTALFRAYAQNYTQGILKASKGVLRVCPGALVDSVHKPNQIGRLPKSVNGKTRNGKRVYEGSDAIVTLLEGETESEAPSIEDVFGPPLSTPIEAVTLPHPISFEDVESGCPLLRSYLKSPENPLFKHYEIWLAVASTLVNADRPEYVFPRMRNPQDTAKSIRKGKVYPKRCQDLGKLSSVVENKEYKNEICPSCPHFHEKGTQMCYVSGRRVTQFAASGHKAHPMKGKTIDKSRLVTQVRSYANHIMNLAERELCVIGDKAQRRSGPLYAYHKDGHLVATAHTASNHWYKELDFYRRRPPSVNEEGNVLALLKKEAAPGVLDPKDLNRFEGVALLNGILSPDGKTLRKIEKKDNVLGRLNFSYDPNAECEALEVFLESVTQGDKAKRTLLLLAAAHTVLRTPLDLYQQFFFLYGRPGSGKSAFLRLLRGLVTATEGGKGFTNLLGDTHFVDSDIVASCMLILPEFREGTDVRRIKALTRTILELTGEGEITFDRKNENSVTFRPRGALFMVSNEVPNFFKEDVAFARRVVGVEFSHVPTKAEKQRWPDGLIEKAILNDAGKSVLLRESLKALREYRERENTYNMDSLVTEGDQEELTTDEMGVEAFLEDYVEFIPEFKEGTPQRDFYELYKEVVPQESALAVQAFDRKFKVAISEVFGEQLKAARQVCEEHGLSIQLYYRGSFGGKRKWARRFLKPIKTIKEIREERRKEEQVGMLDAFGASDT